MVPWQILLRHTYTCQEHTTVITLFGQMTDFGQFAPKRTDMIPVPIDLLFCLSICV